MSGPITTRSTRIARRRAISFTILVGISVLCMAFSTSAAVRELQNGAGYAFRPLQGAMAGVASTVGSVVESIREIDRLRQDNRDLRARLDELAAENARLRALQPENDQLTALLQVRTGFAYHTIAATVIARERPDVARVVTIDRGSDDGLAMGDVVVGPGGALAGRITGLAPNSSHVTLINDPSATVTGMVQSNRATGDVAGQLGGVLVMTNIDSTERVNIGDEVVTAGIVLGGGVRSPYPKGLPIGQVFDVQRDANAVVQTAYLAPAVDLSKAEYLLVITDYEGGLPQPSPDASPSAQP
ncbi:MAG TPA: rod shape-determining protein MreC [Candidatus Limnocylindria bacterium]|nr:rod shape-determining protein MreC [Candidatus Limnocylindria bacterium]